MPTIVPAATDYLTATAQKIVALLNASAYFTATVQPGNIFSLVGGKKWPLGAGQGPQKFPRLEIRVNGSKLGALTSRGGAPTFGNSRVTPIGDAIYPASAEFQLKFIYDGIDRQPGDAMDAEVKRILVLAGERLGMQQISSRGDVTMKMEEKNNQETGGTLRLVQTFTIPVNYLLHKADLNVPLS